MRNAALWISGRTLALLVFAATSLASCATAHMTVQAIFYPEQTDFPGGAPPPSFQVVIRNPQAAGDDARYELLRWQRAHEILAKEPQRARLTTKEWGRSTGFRVIEETPRYQVVEARFHGTIGIWTRYRAEDGKITPLSYKTDGGVAGFIIYLIPLYALGLWLGLAASRRFLAFFIARTRARPMTARPLNAQADLP